MSRLLYCAAAMVTVLLGLSSRIESGFIPSFVSSHFGDMLWAAMVYFGLRLLFIDKSVRFAAAASLLFCFAIEFSQLYQAPWINRVRGTVPGALVLGRGFLPVDLIRYTVGIALASGIDAALKRRRHKETR